MGRAGPIAGIGLRSVHIAEIERDRPAAGFLEIHAENYLTGSGAVAAVEKLRSQYELSVHAVGLSLGSGEGIDRRHLARVATLIERLQPAYVSDHLSWSVADGRYFNDLLPLPCTEEALAVVARNVECVQEALRRPISIENPSCYLAFAQSTMSEPEFLSELVRRTGCGLLLDANNIHVTAHNLRLDPLQWLNGLPGAAITQYHLAGHAVNDADGHPILIDDHGSPVSDPVWRLFGEVVRRFGSRPTLIEWDTDIPPVEVLLGEAERARSFLKEAGDEARAA